MASFKKFIRKIFPKKRTPEIKTEQKEPSFKSLQNDRDESDKVGVRQSAQKPQLKTDSRQSKIQVTIGLDFGTAFTKVVLGENRGKYGVPFNSKLSGVDKYLIAGKLYLNSDGSCSLQKTFNTIKVIDQLKIRILDNDVDQQTKVYIAAYLSLIMGHSRNWLLTAHSDTYKNNIIDWALNVGLPTGKWGDESLKTLYKKIAYAAWCASFDSDQLNLKSVERYFHSPEILTDHLSQGDTIYQDDIGLFPEFAAQVTGYVRSPQRQQGLHTLMDVGAGTLDLAVFNVHKSDGEDIYPIFTSGVQPTGTLNLIRNRLNSVNYQGSWKPSQSNTIPEAKTFCEKLNLTHQELDELDSDFKVEILKEFYGQLDYTKKYKDPLSPTWKSGVPIFLCGGGAKVDFYKIMMVERESSDRPFRIRLVPLPVPDELEVEDISEQEYNRLSVGYGLAFDAFDIGEIRPQDEVGNMDEGIKIITQSCKCCNGTGLYGNCNQCGGTGIAS